MNVSFPSNLSFSFFISTKAIIEESCGLQIVVSLVVFDTKVSTMFNYVLLSS